ncbi:MAG TPA: malic enzyme-like NAD(P)-binding protein [Oscillospiraceae bacterium]|nr:malic enzyme-like NAD(P)-binding protein [Oscillospiraceae bacterium]
MSLLKEALDLHKKWKGKIEVVGTAPIANQYDLSTAYTPGVAEPCKAIYKDKDKVYDYTRKWNLVAVVSDGTAVLGLGDIGPEASMPVMEGKSVLFKTFADVDAFPICLNTTDVDEIVNTIKAIEPTFGGINLEDIAAPRCFEIEKRLKEELNIPVFHDDQHGTAIVVLSGIINALKLVKKDIKDIKVIINGAGAAGIAVTKLLVSMGLKTVILCDRKGAIYKGRDNMNFAKEEIAEITNSAMEKGTLDVVIKEADVFIGVSGPNTVTKEMIANMGKDPIVFAMSNPEPEIYPNLAIEAGARIVGTGRSDFPNQVNNVLAFPGVFRGALDARATDINEEMKIAAAHAIASLVSEDELTEEYVIPKAFDERVSKKVAKEVYVAAVKSGVAKIY